MEDQWQTYQVPLSVTGTMTMLRIDPLLGAGTVDFDWIRLITPDSPLAAK